MLQYDVLEVDSSIPASWTDTLPDRRFKATVTAERISVALTGYPRLHAESLQICIEQTADLAFSASIPVNGFAEIKGLNPAVIVLQQQATVLATIEFIRDIQECQPDASIVVSNVPANPICNIRYLEAGVRGYVYEHESMDQLLGVVRMVGNGQPRLGPDLAGPLLSRLVELNEQLGKFHLMPDDPLPLSQREEEVALEISKGKSNQEIADDLFISTGTVKNHVHRILRKLNVKDRQQAAIIYRQMRELADGEQAETCRIPA